MFEILKYSSEIVKWNVPVKMLKEMLYIVIEYVKNEYFILNDKNDKFCTCCKAIEILFRLPEIF